MKKIMVIIVIAVFGVLIPPLGTSAMMHTEPSQVESRDNDHESLDEVLPELLTKYSKDTIQELDCEDLTDEEFERVGDAVMESMHPDEAHKRMDEMMACLQLSEQSDGGQGGEGSESLGQMHIQMGKRYFACGLADLSGGMGMMGTMMMSSNKMMGSGSMMSAPFGMSPIGSFGGVYFYLGIAAWLLFIVFLIAGIRWFWKRAEK